MASIELSKLSQFKNLFSEKYLNPMQCNLSFMKCNTVTYFIIGGILLFAVLLLLFANQQSGIKLLLSTVCLCAIFIACSLVLINLCVSNAPGVFSYITIGGAILMTLVIVLAFRKSKTPAK